eukprot:CAMPEP_0183718398 /NCGR_PEP_ID=MMETSP0737-20130205/11667_1 /TAXON_ID=385413 /ORGANISM="Thalassiosira miniscula, Strain CCMP1093" /LENGTH=137 /DNA_ID=CAMNT_0025947949 /DNA_START=1 /DNA_END=414 /DNA_ORIENTATION=-
MRVRIKKIIEHHESLVWWKDDVAKSPDENLLCVEHLIALVVVMYDVTTWSFTTAGNTDDFTGCMFDEEDDILHIGQMIADLWERVDRSLSRDAYSKLGVDGLERGGAINEMIGLLVHNSRMFISGLMQENTTNAIYP